MFDAVVRANLLVTPEGPCSLENCRTKETRSAAVAISGGRIERVDEWDRIKALDAKVVLDYSDYLMTPGLVDAHTHLIYSGNRGRELKWKLEGLDYKEIAERGGGIFSTTRSTREADASALLELARKRCASSMASGVTTLEVKTGYGLTYQDEVKLLYVLSVLKSSLRARLIRSVLAAHAMPPEFPGGREGYINSVVMKLSEYAAKTGLAEFVDVFCEPGYFSISETRNILSHASNLGLGLKVHADEFVRSGGAGLAAELGATSADHLGKASRSDLELMARKGVTAVLLPMLFHYAMLDPPNLEKYRGIGLRVALASDFNPNSPNDSMIVTMNHACYNMRMLPDEALCGATTNAASALGLHDVGAIRTGWRADLAVFDVDDQNDLITRCGRSPLVFSMCEGLPILRE